MTTERWRSLPGLVDLSEPGAPMGYGPAFTEYLAEQRRAEAIERAAELNPGATANRITSTERVAAVGKLYCRQCQASTRVLENGLCSDCSVDEALVWPTELVRCEICLGTGQVSVPVPPAPIEEPAAEGETGEDAS